jgi:hypothetical protein
MVMIMMHDKYSVIDRSEAPPEFDKELDLYLSAFGYVGICV